MKIAKLIDQGLDEGLTGSLAGPNAAGLHRSDIAAKKEESNWE
jgi:hypothetical protein